MVDVQLDVIAEGQRVGLIVLKNIALYFLQVSMSQSSALVAAE